MYNPRMRARPHPAVNPELFGLVQRIRAIYAIVGGESGRPTGKKPTNDFDYRKSLFIAHLHNIDKLVDTRDSAGLAPGTRDHIRVKTAIASEMKALQEELDDLAKLNSAEIVKRGGKMTLEEVNARKEVMSTLLMEYQTLFKRVTGYAHRDAEEMSQAGAGMTRITAENFKKGAYTGAGVKTTREVLTAEHHQAMAQITAVRAVQDALLEEIEKGVDELKDAADKIHDELQLQSKMIDDLDKHTDRAQSKMDAVNTRLTDVMRIANDRSSNFCVYAICIVILLAVGVIIYNMLMKR